MSLYPSLEDLKVDKVIQVWWTLQKKKRVLMAIICLIFNPGKGRLIVVENLFFCLTLKGKGQPVYFVA